MRLPDPIDVPRPTGYYDEMHGPEALNEIPQSRDAIADVIANWSAADANMRILLIGSFGTNLEVASNLVDRARADDFLDVLLPVALAIRERFDMEAATASFLAARRLVKTFRDTLAHGVFAVRSDLPDKILVANGNTYRKDHARVFQHLNDEPFQLQHEIRFKLWSEEDFTLARAVARGLLNSAQAMSVCLARDSEEIGLWRSALEQNGLLPKPPYLM